MSKYRRGALYFRRMKPTDGADSIFTAYRMAFLEALCQEKNRKPPVVAVRHGFPGEVIQCALSKKELLDTFRPRSYRHIRQFFKISPNQ